MTKEELLKPRWKVIASYPGNKRKVGGIIDSLHDAYDQEELERQLGLYPHIFKKLEWWEERDENDLPKYFRNDYGVHRIQKPIKEYAQHNWYIEPATEQEYNDYINQKK